MGKLWEISVIVLMAMHCINSSNMYAANWCGIIEDTAVRNDKSYISTESADMDGYVKIFTFGSPRIVSEILLIKDETAFFRTQSYGQYFSNTYTQVELDQEVVNKIYRLFNEIYSSHESVIKSDLPDVPLMILSESSDLSIEINLNGRIVNEEFDIIGYEATYLTELEIVPFYEQFVEILKTMDSISYRMEHEFYNFDYNHINKKRMEDNQALGQLYDSESMECRHF